MAEPVVDAALAPLLRESALDEIRLRHAALQERARELIPRVRRVTEAELLDGLR